MQVYLIAAEGDAGIATECAEFLRKHGCIVRVALGENLYMPARAGEFTVALWSLKTRMSAKQIMFTNRAIDALMEGTLAVGQLDFHPLPYGLTDIQAYDLRSAPMRHFEMNKLLAGLRAAQRAKLNPPPSPATETEEAISDTLASCAEESVDDEIGASEPACSDASQVFVSYAFANSDVVLPLVEDVQESGTSIWIDKEQIKPGTHWAGNIVRAIKGSKLLCLMCSAQSFASDHVRREIYLADKYEKPILPVKLDGALMPEDIEYFLIDRQFLDMTGFAFSDRVEALRGALTS